MTEHWQDPAPNTPKTKKTRVTKTLKAISTSIVHNQTDQPNCPLFTLPGELRNEIYLLVAGHHGKGVVLNRKRIRDTTTSLDPLSLTCKLIRNEYLDVLAKQARTLVAREVEDSRVGVGFDVGLGFVNTYLLRYEVADPNQKHEPKKRKRRGGR